MHCVRHAFLCTNVMIIVVTLIIQFAFLAYTFPLVDWQEGHGLFYIDHPFHLYQVSLGRSLLERGSLLGYDPFFGGGSLGGVTFNPSAKLPVLISALIPASASTERLYLYYVFSCALVGPASIAGAGLLLRWPAIHTAMAALTGILFWWIGAFRWYHTAGMVSFVCACYASLPYSVSVFQELRSETTAFFSKKIAAAGLLGGLGLWLHPLFGLLAAVTIASLLLTHYDKLRLVSTVGKATAIGLLALTLNTPWILAMEGNSEILNQPYQREAGGDLLLAAVMGVWQRAMGSVLNPLVVLLGVVALRFTEGTIRRQVIAFIIAGSGLVLFAAFAANFKALGALQPNRFFAPGFLLIGIAATRTTIDFASRLRTSRLISPQFAVLVTAFVAIAVLAGELGRELTPGSHGHYGKAPPEVTAPPESVLWMESWIKKHTSPDGRILFETSLSRRHGGGHVAGYLALRTEREFIGAPYPFFMPDRSFWDRTAFGLPLKNVSDERLLSVFEAYNVAWIIAHDSELVQRLEALPLARLLARREDIHIFGLRRQLSYFASGDAKVVARGFNRVHVSAKSGDNLRMRYHWVKGITTTPASTIEPVSLSADLPPFIQVINAPEHFVVHVRP